MAWKEVEGFPGYWVSDDGQVRGHRGLLSGSTSGGYVRVLLYRFGNPSPMWVHRLVAMTFVDGYEPGLEVDHLNGDKADNRASNLQWVTHSENLRRAEMTGWSRAPRAVVREDGAIFPSTIAAAQASGIAPVTVWKAAKGLSKRPRIGFKFAEKRLLPPSRCDTI